MWQLKQLPGISLHSKIKDRAVLVTITLSALGFFFLLGEKGYFFVHIQRWTGLLYYTDVDFLCFSFLIFSLAIFKGQGLASLYLLWKYLLYNESSLLSEKREKIEISYSHNLITWRLTTFPSMLGSCHAQRKTHLNP